MKSKTILCGVATAAVLQLGALAGSAQADVYGYTGSETNVTLDPGTYIITAYGASGGRAYIQNGSAPPAFATGGGGAEMSAEFNFSSPATLTLLVGLGGGSHFVTNEGSDAGGGGGSFVVDGSTPLVVAGGGGGAVANLSAGAVEGGNATVSTFGGTGSGSAGGSGGANGSGGGGGDLFTNTYVVSSITLPGGMGAAGGGGFYGYGDWGNNNTGTGVPSYSLGGADFEEGGAGGRDNTAYDDAAGGFGGGGGGVLGATYGSFPNDFFGGGGGGYSGGGGGGEGLPTGECGAGGGGGSFIDSSEIAILVEVAGTSGAGTFQPAYPGEIIITALPEPASAGLFAIGSLALLRWRRSRLRHFLHPRKSI